MKTLKFAALAALSVFALACTKNDPEGEGKEEVRVGTVLFSANNATSLYVAPGAAAEIEIEVVRLDEETPAATYAIKVVDTADGVEIPSSVAFAEGKTSASIKIKAPAGKAYDKFGFEIQLTGDNVNASANSDQGTIRFEGAIYVYDESYTRGYFDESTGKLFKYLGYFKQKVWRMADGIVVFKDFLGCGADLTLKMAEQETSGYGKYLSFVDFSNAEYCDVWEPWWEGEETASTVDDLGFAPYKYITEDSGEYLPCLLKGDERRYIDAIDLYFCDTYTGYVERPASFDYIYLTPSYVSVVGESEGIAEELSNWPYLYFGFLSEDKLANVDFGYPELGGEELICEGTTTLWGLNTTGSASLYKVTMGDGSVYYTVKSWYGGDSDLEFAFDENGAPYVSNVSVEPYNGYDYTYYYTGRSDYMPYYLTGYPGYDPFSVTDAAGNALTEISKSTSSVVISLSAYSGVWGYSSDWVDMKAEDPDHTAWVFTYNPAQ